MGLKEYVLWKFEKLEPFLEDKFTEFDENLDKMDS